MSSLSGVVLQDQFHATKRKLDDAFLELDNSVITPELLDGPRPAKRSNTSRSIYSTLTKYGISTKSALPQPAVVSVALTKPTPHLSAILARAATRTKSILSFRLNTKASSSDATLSTNAEYRPSSVASFLSRLSTFRLSTYANKPPQIDAVAASRCGWTNEGKDRLVCCICGASWIVASRDGMSRDAANALVDKQHVSLVEAHKHGCPWKIRQSDPSIYCIPLQSPTVTVRKIKATAISLDEPLKSVTIKHPLTQTQVNSVTATILAYCIPASSEEAVGQRPDVGQPPEAAILAALFGWSVIPSTTGQESQIPAFSRNATSVPGTPTRSPSTSRATTPARSAQARPNFSSIIPNNRDTLLHCVLCQRRIGLWTFLGRTSTVARVNGTNDTGTDSQTSTPPKLIHQRQFDLVREHRSYCPYVIRSTAIPTIPVSTSVSSSNDSQPRLSRCSQDGVMEGWRAVLTMILRHGLGQKQVIDYDVFSREGESNRKSEDVMEMDEVKAMVTGVKSRGGKDLLKYVRGLLN